MLNKITEHVYVLPYDDITDRPNLYYIKGSKFSVAIDAGASKKHVELFYKSIKELGFDLPSYTIITHWHWDHSFGLKFINGKSISSTETYKILEDVINWKWDLESMIYREKEGLDIPFCNQHILVEYEDLNDIKVALPDIAIDEKVLDLGDLTLNIKYMDAPHSEDSLFIELVEEKILFIGDADCGDFYYNCGNYDVELTQKLIDYIKDVNPRLILGGHNNETKVEDELSYLNDVIAGNGIVSYE